MLYSYTSNLLRSRVTNNVQSSFPFQNHLQKPRSANSTVSTTSESHMANADTGTDDNYMCTNDNTFIKDICPDTSRTITQPDDTTITSTHSGYIDWPWFPLSACKCFFSRSLSAR